LVICRAAALRHIARERITSLYLVPTLYHDLVGHPDFAACDTSSVTKLRNSRNSHQN
jgi:2-furoate---CoA ligase